MRETRCETFFSHSVSITWNTEKMTIIRQLGRISQSHPRVQNHVYLVVAQRAAVIIADVRRLNQTRCQSNICKIPISTYVRIRITCKGGGITRRAKARLR